MLNVVPEFHVVSWYRQALTKKEQWLPQVVNMPYQLLISTFLFAKSDLLLIVFLYYLLVMHIEKWKRISHHSFRRITNQNYQRSNHQMIWNVRCAITYCRMPYWFHAAETAFVTNVILLMMMMVVLIPLSLPLLFFGQISSLQWNDLSSKSTNR